MCMCVYHLKNYYYYCVHVSNCASPYWGMYKCLSFKKFYLLLLLLCLGKCAYPYWGMYKCLSFYKLYLLLLCLGKCLRTVFGSWSCPFALLKQDLPCFLAVFSTGVTLSVLPTLQGRRWQNELHGFVGLLLLLFGGDFFLVFIFVLLLFVCLFWRFLGFSVFFLRPLSEIRLLGKLGRLWDLREGKEYDQNILPMYVETNWQLWRDS